MENPRMHARKRGFSLIELVIVVVIIGIIGAIAIPRMSRGSAGAADNALRGNLAVLRGAIETFAAEHDGLYPSATDITVQLTQYSDSQGTTNASRTATHIYGPYIREIPPLPVGARKGSSGIATADGAGVGWIYNPTSGAIRANTTTEADVSGKLYSDY
jgi:prepilin-type N-terminal cleavage/methylation domain-containing protein